jgi:hypothetical protein
VYGVWPSLRSADGPPWWLGVGCADCANLLEKSFTVMAAMPNY